MKRNEDKINTFRLAATKTYKEKQKYKYRFFNVGIDILISIDGVLQIQATQVQTSLQLNMKVSYNGQVLAFECQQHRFKAMNGKSILLGLLEIIRHSE